MDIRTLAIQLSSKPDMKAANWHVDTLEKWLNQGCRCIYCNKDFFENYDTYRTIEIDHLLPTSEFPEVEHDASNHVIACRGCNLLKRHWYPRELHGEFEYTKRERVLRSEHRDLLIARARAYVRDIRHERELLFLKERQIVRDALGETFAANA